MIAPASVAEAVARSEMAVRVGDGARVRALVRWLVDEGYDLEVAAGLVDGRMAAELAAAGRRAVQ